jgi:hypothetical protein
MIPRVFCRFQQSCPQNTPTSAVLFILCPDVRGLWKVLTCAGRDEKLYIFYTVLVNDLAPSFRDPDSRYHAITSHVFALIPPYFTHSARKVKYLQPAWQTTAREEGNVVAGASSVYSYAAMKWKSKAASLPFSCATNEWAVWQLLSMKNDLLPISLLFLDSPYPYTEVAGKLKKKCWKFCPWNCPWTKGLGVRT